MVYNYYQKDYEAPVRRSRSSYRNSNIIIIIIKCFSLRRKTFSLRNAMSHRCCMADSSRLMVVVTTTLFSSFITLFLCLTDDAYRGRFILIHHCFA